MRHVKEQSGNTVRNCAADRHWWPWPTAVTMTVTNYRDCWPITWDRLPMTAY